MDFDVDLYLIRQAEDYLGDDDERTEEEIEEYEREREEEAYYDAQDRADAAFDAWEEKHL